MSEELTFELYWSFRSPYSYYLGLPFRWPARPDPLVTEAGRFDAYQPRITRLSRLGVAAAEAGRGLEFIGEVSRLIFSGEVDGWDQGEHLAQAAARAGLDLRTLESSDAAQQQRLDQVVAENEQAQAQAGHWGVPLMVFQGEPFFGQDRLELLIRRLRQHGLEPR